MIPPEAEANLRRAGIPAEEFAHGYRASDSCVVATRVVFDLGLKVVPTKPTQKIPTIRGWQHSASADLGQVLRWREHFRCDFSILTGIDSGVWALDFDGPQGTEDLNRLSAELGPLPPTIKVISGRASGGFHLWFRATPENEDLRTTSKIFGCALDARGWHGHIVIPGSLHKSGDRYRFAENCAPDEVGLASLPKGWFDALPKRQEYPVKNGSARQKPRGKRPLRLVAATSFVIGDGDGRGGFDAPIYKNAIRFFFKAGSEAPAEIIIETLRAIIIAAPKDHSRDVSRYLSGPDLPRIVERARQFVEDVKESESEEHEYD